MRSLERKIAAICRAVAVKVAEGHGVTTSKELSSECLEQQGGRTGTLRKLASANTHLCTRHLMGHR